MAPSNLPNKYRDEWARPWERKARKNRGFKRWLRKHGFLSPNFRLSEASGKGRHSLGTDVPVVLRKRAQRHAFNLERLRHALGDNPMRLGSWYRNPRHNSAVGGARFSRHMSADATDHFTPVPPNFDRIAESVFANGGFGRYPSGSRHTDSRGFRARW